MLLGKSSSFLAFLLLLHNINPIVQAKSCTTQLGSTKVSPVPTYTTVFTVTTTLTEYLTTITKTKTKGTTAIPTPPGFTPILSETTSIPDAKQAAATTPGHNAVTASFPATVICTTTTTKTLTKSITDPHKVAASTVTITSTTAVPAATIYAACGPDNIVNQGIRPPGAGHAIEVISEGFGTDNRTLIYNGHHGLRLLRPMSTGVIVRVGLFADWIWGIDAVLPEPLCVLETDYFGGCNGGIDFGDAYFQVDLIEYPEYGPGQGEIMFNGPCGRIFLCGSV